MTDAELLNLVSQKVLSGGRKTTAQYVRDLMNAVIGNKINPVEFFIGSSSEYIAGDGTIKSFSDIDDFLKLDGSNSPSADINFGGKSIYNIDEIQDASSRTVLSATLRRFYDSAGHVFFDCDSFLFYGQGGQVSWDTWLRELPSADGSTSIKYSYNDRMQIYKDIKFDTESIGLILKDRTTSTYYRLYIDGAALALEAV